MTEYGLPQPTTTAPAGCTDSEVVLLVGDSLMGQAAQAITTEFHYRGFPVTTYVMSKGEHEVRWADGVHLTPDGAARVARWTVTAMAGDAC